MTARVVLSAVDAAAVDAGRFVVVRFDGALDVDGIAIGSALVGRGDGGALVAYANVCRHQAVPLDLDSGEVMSDDGRHLVCLRHGALYAPATGRCVTGPCEGATLFSLAVDEVTRPGGARAITVRAELLRR